MVAIQANQSLLLVSYLLLLLCVVIFDCKWIMQSNNMRQKEFDKMRKKILHRVCYLIFYVSILAYSFIQKLEKTIRSSL